MYLKMSYWFIINNTIIIVSEISNPERESKDAKPAQYPIFVVAENCTESVPSQTLSPKCLINSFIAMLQEKYSLLQKTINA